MSWVRGGEGEGSNRRGENREGGVILCGDKEPMKMKLGQNPRQGCRFGFEELEGERVHSHCYEQARDWKPDIADS